MSTGRRTAWVDLTRGVLVLLVVIYHVRNGATGAGVPVPGWLDQAIRGLEPVRMPVLMVLSGMFLPRGLAKGLRRYATGKVSALLVPYVGWFLLFYFVLLAGTHRPTDRWYVEVVVPQTPLWFLAYLTAYFALSLPLRTPWARAGACVAVLAWLQLGGTDTDWHFLFYYACFLTGSVLADPPPGLGALPERVRAWPPVVLAVAAVPPTAYAVVTAVRTDHTDRTPVMVLHAGGALLVLRWLAGLAVETGVGRWLTGIGSVTMVVFITHTAFLAAVPSPTGSVWGSLAVTYGITLAAVAVVRRHEEAWLLFDVRRGWRAVRRSAQAGPDVQADLGVDDDLLRR